MWYAAYKMQKETGFLLGQKHGTIVETAYTDREHPVIKELERTCRSFCQSAWSVGYFPDKHKGITFRFFSPNDMELFNEALQEIEGGF